MPFRSKKQRAFLYANKPEMAKKWASEHGNKIVKKNKGGYMMVEPRGFGKNVTRKKTENKNIYMSSLAGSERLMEHEGFMNQIYTDTRGFATIGYGHLITKKDNFVEGKEYEEEELYQLFKIDLAKSNRRI